MTRIAIFTDEPGWHGERLREAFAARAAETRFVSLRDCALDLDSDGARLRIPGFEDTLPDAAFVRGIAGGTLEEVVFRLDVLHALDALGVPVYNDGRAIERSVDKSLTSFLLASGGLPTPTTLVTSERAAAEAFTAAECDAGQRVVCKPLFGSQGEGLMLLDDVSALPDTVEINGVWYLQRFIDTAAAGSADWRLLVIGGHVAAAVRRTSDGWRANVAQGGRCHAALADGEARTIAERSTAILGMAYAGVDLLHDADGRWWVLEVNSIPAWRGLQRAWGLDVAALLADDLLRHCLDRKAIAV